MPKHYVTFGQKHVHTIDGKELNKDTVAVFDADFPCDGIAKAFDLFGGDFLHEYFDHEWNDASKVEKESKKYVEV